MKRICDIEHGTLQTRVDHNTVAITQDITFAIPSCQCEVITDDNLSDICFLTDPNLVTEFDIRLPDVPSSVADGIVSLFGPFRNTAIPNINTLPEWVVEQLDKHFASSSLKDKVRAVSAIMDALSNTSVKAHSYKPEVRTLTLYSESGPRLCVLGILLMMCFDHFGCNQSHFLSASYQPRNSEIPRDSSKITPLVDSSFGGEACVVTRHQVLYSNPMSLYVSYMTMHQQSFLTLSDPKQEG